MGRTQGRTDELGDHLGDGQSVMFADVVEEPHGMILYHDVVRRQGLLSLVDPSLHYVSTAFGTEVLVCRGGGGGGRRKRKKV